MAVREDTVGVGKSKSVRWGVEECLENRSWCMYIPPSRRIMKLTSSPKVQRAPLYHLSSVV